LDFNFQRFGCEPILRHGSGEPNELGMELVGQNTSGNAIKRNFPSRLRHCIDLLQESLPARLQHCYRAGIAHLPRGGAQNRLTNRTAPFAQRFF
jgi:hypothetical protein